MPRIEFTVTVVEPAKEILRLGVTGHRFLSDITKLQEGVERALDTIEDCYPGRSLVLITQLAEGADRLVATIGLDRGASLVALLPLSRDEFMKDFHSQESQDEFANLLGRASEVLELPERADRAEAYEAAGLAMLDCADVLLALWDGAEAQGRGGTAEIVRRARERGIPLVWVLAHNNKPGSPGPTPLRGEQGRVSTERLDPIADAYRRRDEAAGRHQRRRWQYALFAVALSPIAAALLACQGLFFPHGGLAAIILIAFGVVVLSVALPNYPRMGRSHRCWIDGRLRAESVRGSGSSRLQR